MIEVDFVNVVVLSGPVAVGKSTLAAALANQLSGTHVRTRDLLKARAEKLGVVLSASRRELQTYGDHVDEETAGAWLVSEILSWLPKRHAPDWLIVDAARRPSQIEQLRRRFEGTVHVHLFADIEVLQHRYRTRGPTGIAELPDYVDVADNLTEQCVHDLAENADIALDAGRIGPLELQQRVLTTLIPSVPED